LPRAADVPRTWPILIEGGDPHGPYGAKAIGECSINPPASVISNAVYDAIGVRLRELPITPDKIINALAEREDYATIARSAGIANAITIDNVADLQARLPGIVGTPGPHFVVLKVEPMLYHYEGAEMKYRFARSLEKKLGITVFGPRATNASDRARRRSAYKATIQIEGNRHEQNDCGEKDRWTGRDAGG
jgi:hypothetical protein